VIGNVSIARVETPDDDVRALIDELDRALTEGYEPEQHHGLALEAIFATGVRFFVASLDGAPVGCGGVALLDGYAEVKRMYVRERVRGRGVARAVLARLEAEARSCGARILRLETGDRQHAAIRLYERAGFARCPAFGPYAAMPPRAIATSIFYEKRLDVADGP